MSKTNFSSWRPLPSNHYWNINTQHLNKCVDIGYSILNHGHDVTHKQGWDFIAFAYFYEALKK